MIMNNGLFTYGNCDAMRDALKRVYDLCGKRIAIGATRLPNDPRQSEEIVVVRVRSITIHGSGSVTSENPARVRAAVDSATFFRFPIEYIEIDPEQPSNVMVLRNLDGWQTDEGPWVPATIEILD